MMTDFQDFAHQVGLHTMDMSSPALPMPQLNRASLVSITDKDFPVVWKPSAICPPNRFLVMGGGTASI